MSGHTPGKWDVEIARRGYGLYQIWDENGNAPKDEEEEANAEFIVRACNSHEELLEALKNLLGFHCSPEMLPAGASERCAVVNAELAIIHAEKKEWTTPILISPPPGIGAPAFFCLSAVC